MANPASLALHPLPYLAAALAKLAIVWWWLRPTNPAEVLGFVGIVVVLIALSAAAHRCRARLVHSPVGRRRHLRAQTVPFLDECS